MSEAYQIVDCFDAFRRGELPEDHDAFRLRGVGLEVCSFVEEVVALPDGVEELAVAFAHFVVADEVGELVLHGFHPHQFPDVREAHFSVPGQGFLDLFGQRLHEDRGEQVDAVFAALVLVKEGSLEGGDDFESGEEHHVLLVCDFAWSIPFEDDAFVRVEDADGALDFGLTVLDAADLDCDLDEIVVVCDPLAETRLSRFVDFFPVFFGPGRLAHSRDLLEVCFGAEQLDDAFPEFNEHASLVEVLRACEVGFFPELFVVQVFVDAHRPELAVDRFERGHVREAEVELALHAHSQGHLLDVVFGSREDERDLLSVVHEDFADHEALVRQHRADRLAHQRHHVSRLLRGVARPDEVVFGGWVVWRGPSWLEALLQVLEGVELPAPDASPLLLLLEQLFLVLLFGEVFRLFGGLLLVLVVGDFVGGGFGLWLVWLNAGRVCGQLDLLRV